MLSQTGFRALAILACVSLIAPGTALAKKPQPKPKPDLSIMASPLVPGTPYAGASLYAHATVRAGKIPAKASKTVFVLSRDTVRDKKDTLLATAATKAIKAGKSSLTSAKIVIPANLTGAFYVIACADGANKVAEASEKNNCKASAKKLVQTPPAPKTPAPELPTLAFSATRSSPEGNPGSTNQLEYDVSLSAPSTGAVTFHWAATATGVTSSPSDFVASSGDVTVPAGQSLTTLRVPIVGDTLKESDEPVRVKITNEHGVKNLTSVNDHADATIIDDDGDAALEITELNPNVTGGGLVELRAKTSGVIDDLNLSTAPYTSASQVTFPAIHVLAGDTIVVHYGSPVGVTSETSTKGDCVAAACYSSAWDITTALTLTGTAKVVALITDDDVVIDGVVVRSSSVTTGTTDQLDNLDGLQMDDLWEECADGTCDDGTEFDSVAVDWSTAATSANGVSLRRGATDTNSHTNWSIGASSWGS